MPPNTHQEFPLGLPSEPVGHDGTPLFTTGNPGIVKPVAAAPNTVLGGVSVDQTTDGTTNRVTVGKTVYVDVTLTIDNGNALASGDIAAATQVITNLTRAADMGGVIESITLIDGDDQKAALDIYFLSANVSIGTVNAAPSITDADAAAIMGAPISIGTGDYRDLGGVSVAGADAVGKAIMPAATTRNGYVAVVNGTGTPTYTTGKLILRIGILQD